MPRYVVAVGSTGPLAEQNVRDAIARIPGVLSQSDIRPTIAVGGATALRFANAAIVVESPHAAATLLRELHALEARAGRVRTVKNAARALDLDIVLGVDLVAPLDATELVVPHPRALERAFVVGPACEALERAGIPVPHAWRSAARARS